jgi:predicted nucleic acid-binding protein
MRGFAELAIARYPADWLRPRMWALRHNLSACDATYIARPRWSRRSRY